MTSRPVQHDLRSETGSAGPVSWHKSRHSAAGAGAACVEITPAESYDDGSVAVLIPGGSRFVLVAPRSDDPVLQEAARPRTLSAEPWTRGSLDENDDVLAQPTPLEADSAAQLENAHGLPGFDDTFVIPPGSHWLDSESEQYLSGPASEFHARVAAELKGFNYPRAVPSREEQREVYDRRYPENRQTQQGDSRSRATWVARDIADMKVRGGAPSSRTSPAVTTPAQQRAAVARVEDAMARSVTVTEPIDAEALRVAVKASLPAEKADLVDDVLSDDEVKDNFNEALDTWSASLADGTAIEVHVRSLGEPTGAEEQHADTTSTSAAQSSSTSSTNTQTKDPFNPTKLVDIDTGYVKVSPRVEGIGNSTSSTVTAKHTRTASTSFTRSDGLSDVSGHVATFEVKVTKPAESHLTIPGVHHAPTVETHEVPLSVKLAWPRLDAGADAHGVQLSYPKVASGAAADDRAAVYAEAAKQVESIVGAKVVSPGLRDTVKAAAGEGHDAEVANWVNSLAQLDSRQAQKLVGGESIEHTFGSGDSARTVRIFAKERVGDSSLTSTLVDRSRQTTAIRSTDDGEFSHAESKTRSWGGELKVESGSLFAAGSVGVDLSSTHSHTDLQENTEASSHEVTDQRTGNINTHEVLANLLVHTEGRGKSVDRQVPTRLEVQMRDRSVSPTRSQRPDTPADMRKDQVPDSVHAVYKLDDGTVDQLVGAVLTKAAGGFAGSVPKSLPRLTGEEQRQVSEDLQKLILDNPKDLLDGDEEFVGDGVRYELPGDRGTLIVRGDIQRTAGTYRKSLDGRERDEVLVTRAKQAVTRSSADKSKVSATGGASAGVAALKGELGYSQDRTAADGYTMSWQEKQIWHSSANWHQFRFPVDFSVALERGDKTVDVLSHDDLADLKPDVLVSVPERPGFALPRDPDAADREESDWGPKKISNEPRPEAAPLPARFEIETLKPVRNLRQVATRALSLATNKVSEAPHHADDATLKMAQDDALTEWADSSSRLAKFAQTAGPEELSDRLPLQTKFVGRTHLHDHRAQGMLGLHTELRNPRVVSQDDEHPITRIQGVSTDLSSHQETVHGVEADFTAGPSDATSILGLLSASAEAKAGYHRGQAGSADRSTVEQTTQTHKGRAYLVAYDAEHTIGAQTRFDGKLASGEPVEAVKSVPDAVELWVEASDIRDVGLPPAELAKLAPEDRLGYQDADPTTLKAPGKAGESLGTLELHRGAALSELIDHVDSELDKWAESALKGKNPKLGAQFERLQADVVRQLGERARSGGYSAMMDDARNGGLPLVVTDKQAEGGKRELLVVVRTNLDNGRYHDSLPELSTTTSYKVAHDKQTETSNTLSAEATAGMSGSSAGFGALAAKAAPALTSRISDLGAKGEDLLDKLPDPLSTQADDLVDAAKDKLDDKIGDKLSPAFKAEASRRAAQRQGDGDTSTVTMTRTGPAHRFVYDQRVAIEVHPWAHEGFYKNAALDLVGLSDKSHGVVKGVWHSSEGEIASAVRLTVHEEDYSATQDAERGAKTEPSATLRQGAKWNGVPDDAFVEVLPFPAQMLHTRLSELVDPGVHVGDTKDVVNSFRGANLLTGTSATQLRHHFREEMSPSGYRVDVNSKTLLATTIKTDLGNLEAVKVLRSSSSDQNISHLTVDHGESLTKGGTSLALSSDGPKLGYDGEHENEHDAPKPADKAPDSYSELYLVRGDLSTSVTPEYRPGHQPSGTAKQGSSSAKSTPPVERYTPDGDVWLIADRKGLDALGVRPPASVPDVRIELSSPTTRLPQRSDSGHHLIPEPAPHSDEGHLAAPVTATATHSETVPPEHLTLPQGSGWLDPTSAEYRGGLASEFHAQVAKELQVEKWSHEVPDREEQREIYDQLYPEGQTHLNDLKSRATWVARKITGAQALGGTRSNRSGSSRGSNRSRGSVDPNLAYGSPPRSESSSSVDSNLAYGSPPRSERSSSADSNLAYGPESSTARGPFEGTYGQVRFSADYSGSRMQDVRRLVANTAEHFADELAYAGPITIRFGRTQGGGVGEWRPDTRTITLNPGHADVRQAGSAGHRLLGTAVFEILNASADSRRAGMDRAAVDGSIEHWAAEEGIAPRTYYARALERIEWENAMTHRRIMSDAGRTRTEADIFRGESTDFGPFYRRQVRAGHAHSYEFQYDQMRTQAQSLAARTGGPIYSEPSHYGAPPITDTEAHFEVEPDQRAVSDFFTPTPDGISRETADKLRSLVTVDDAIEQPVSVRAESARLAGLVFGSAAPELAERMANGEAGIVAVARGTSMAQATGVDGWSEGQRGLYDAGSGRVYVTEENLLGLGGHAESGGVGYRDGYSSTVHELSHLLFDQGLTDQQRASVEAAHQAMLEESGGGSADDYAASNVQERFAEAVTAHLRGDLDPDHALAPVMSELYGPDPVPSRANNIAGALADEQNLTAARDLDRLTRGEASPAQSVATSPHTVLESGEAADAFRPTHEPAVQPVATHEPTVHAPGVTQVHEQQHHGEQQIIVPPVVSAPVRDLSSARFNSVPDGVGWSHARLAKSWGLGFDTRGGSAYDALLSASGGSIPVGDRVLDDPDVLRQELGDNLGVVDPSAEDWSAAAEQLGTSVLVLHSDGSMSAHGQGPALVVTEAAPKDEDAVQRWVGLPTSSEGPALSGLSAAQIHWAAAAGQRFGGPGGGFFDALADAGHGSAVPELDYTPQVLRDRLVGWMGGGLPDETWDRIFEQAGIPAPHDDFARQQVIADVRLGGGDSVHLLPVLAGLHYGVGVHVVDTDGGAQTHGAPDAQRSVTLAPAVGPQGHSWFTVGDVRPPHTVGAGTRPADVAGGLGWADSRVPVTDAPDHVGAEPSDAQVEWAYDHGRQLVEIPPGPDARYEAILQSVGGGFTTHGEYVGDPARLRELLADEVKPALEQDLGLALVVHTIYAAHTGSGDALIDSGRAQDEIVEAIRDPEYRPDLADELAPYFANRLGLGVRTVDSSGVVGRYGSGRPVYVTSTVDEGGQRHWTAAPSDGSKYALGSPLRAPNQSDPALFLLNQAIEARKGALRSGGAGDFGSDPVIGQLRAAQSRWLAHGPAPRSSVDEPVVDLRQPQNLDAAVTRLVQSAHTSIGDTGEVTDLALGSGVHAGMAVELFDGLYPQGIGHEPGVTETAQGHPGVTGTPADQWVVASLPELAAALPHGGAALLLGGDHAVVLLDTPDGQRLVDFGTDGVGGHVVGRVDIPTSALEGTGDGLALIVDGGGHPLSAEHLYDTLGHDFDSAVGWSFGHGFAEADPETGAPVGVTAPQAEWARQHDAGFESTEPGPNSAFDAVIKAAGGTLSAHGVDVTDPVQLRQVVAEHVLAQLAGKTLRDFPSVHAAFASEGADRIIEEFFGHDPSGANAHAVAAQLDEHIDSGKANAYVVQALAEPNHWEQVAQPIALDAIAHWSGHSVLSVDGGGQVRLHGDPDAPRLAVARPVSDTDENGWVALTSEHPDAEPFGDVAAHTVTSLTSSIPHTETGEDSFYHAVLDAAGGAIQIDRDTQVSTPAELKAQLTKSLLDRPDVLDPATRESIEQETGIRAGAGVDELVDALNDPASHEGEVVARHLIGKYLGTELKVGESDGTERAYGSGRPLEVKSAPDELGGTRWTASHSLESRDLDLGLGHDEDHGLAAVEAERVAQAQWAPESFDLKAPDEVPAEDPWRSATFCVEMEVDGQLQKACVSVAVLTLDAELAAQLGVTMP